MLKQIFTALALAVICTSTVSNISASASSYGKTTDFYQNLTVYVADGLNKSYTIQNANLTNPFKLAKQVGFAIATQNGGFICNSERNKPKYQQVCSELVLHTDIPRLEDGSVEYSKDCIWRWNKWSSDCYYSVYISDIGNY